MLFVEALSGKYKNAARLSFSTKLVDYFAARKCILAIAPSDHASIEYLRNNELAMTAETDNEIISVLENAYKDRTILNKYAERMYQYAVKHHSKEIIYDIFIDTIMKQKDINEI